MLGLQLRDEFLGSQTPGTVISLRRKDKTGAVQRDPDYILSMTYPTADVQTALRTLEQKRTPRPVVLIGSRGRGKSHIMAVMHHAVASPDQVEAWAKSWANRPETDNLSHLTLENGYVAISEAVHNHEYQFLWDLIFDRHPKGEYFRGKFDDSERYYPPRSLLEEMFQAQPTVLILDEFQKWFDGLPETDKQGRKPREWASNFIQNLSEISVERPDLLILVVSVLNSNTEAYRQIHRNGPVLIDFSGPTARQDRQRMVLHRLFKNRENIPPKDIQTLIAAYAQERFRLRFAHLSDIERSRITNEVVESWPLAPELLELLEDHILMAETAQDKRDLIRILAQVYRARGEVVPLITPADFSVDEDENGVQSLIDSITKSGEQERLREVAQRNLENLQTVGADVPHARELISALWMRSMSPGKSRGGTGAELQLDITRATHLDNNAFQYELNQLIENSINIHGESSPDGRLYFGLEENPRTKVRTTAKNDKLWQINADPQQITQMVYPGHDIAHLQTTLRHILIPETKQPSSRVIVLGPNWWTTPWQEVNDADKPSWWDRPVLIVIPTPLSTDVDGRIQSLGQWLAQHVPKKRNTVRFLLPTSGSDNLYQDKDLVFLARCSYLTSQAWKNDRQYASLKNDFDKPLRDQLKSRFDRFAILRHWNYPTPDQCIFEIERPGAQGSEIPFAVEETIERDLFDSARFRATVLKYAREGWTVGDLLDEIAEPPPSPDQEAIPFLGDSKLYEKVLDIAAKGDIALNVGGKWVGRPADSDSDEAAQRYMRQKAYRSGPEMRQVQLGEPSAVSGSTIKPVTPATPGATTVPVPPMPPVIRIPPPDAGEDIPTSGETAVGETKPGLTSSGGPIVPPELPPLPASTQTRKAEENTGINLSGNFEKWGISPHKTLNTARIEFKGLNVQQLKQVLQRIPAQFRASLEITYLDKKEDGDE